MKIPNWQHHSKKEQKRHLKPQAMRQAKKRRQSLKRKLLAASVLLVGVNSSPASAITWGEFWEPFEVHHHHHHYDPRPVRRYCWTEVEVERYLPGDRWRRGRVVFETKWVERPC